MSLNHITLHVSDIEAIKTFYLSALKPLGYRVSMSFLDGNLLGLSGSCSPDFWLASTKLAEEAKDTETSIAKGETGYAHIAFTASNRAQVRRFYEAALAVGGKCNGPPGLRPQYFATYYAAYVLDPDGRNVEAVCMKPGFWAEEWGFVGWSTAVLSLGVSIGVMGRWFGWL